MARRRWVSGGAAEGPDLRGQAADRKSTQVDQVGEPMAAGPRQADHHPLGKLTGKDFPLTSTNRFGCEIMRNDVKSDV